MDEFALDHERELWEALNDNPDWYFMVTSAVSVDGQVAILFSKRPTVPFKREAQLSLVNDMIQEIRLQAGLQGIIVMADPKALWMAGWSNHGAAG